MEVAFLANHYPPAGARVGPLGTFWYRIVDAILDCLVPRVYTRTNVGFGSLGTIGEPLLSYDVPSRN